MAVPCVNEIDEKWPLEMKYSTKRLPQPGVNINVDPAFMVCCDCTDDCTNKDKCACWQLTLEGVRRTNDGKVDANAGYSYRRLVQAEPISTGIYECHLG